ncbi:hypothetical protein V8B97DRAFT_599701 [Scleroderma yunnanense]
MSTDPTSSSHSLPAIPTLPPIQIPGHDDDLMDEPSSPRLPSATFSPQDSTSSSTSSPALTRNPSFIPHSSSVDQPLQHHRKSASVDSLPIYQPGESSRATSLTGVRSNISATTDSPRTRRTELSVDSRRRREPETIPPYARSRGHSVSSMSDSHDSTFEQVFESDLWRPSKRPIDRPRRGSVKGSEQARASRRPGDLKLPPRNQLPPVPFTQFAHPLPRDDNRRLHSTVSLQSFPKHPSLTDVMSGRVRSGSLGLQADTTSLRSRSLFIDTVQSTPYPREFSIAVVGTPGCGKSTFIAEDARTNGVSDVSALFSVRGSSPPFRYTRNIDRLKRDSPYCSVIIHELDITRVTTPPSVDGIFICYDNGDASSFAPISNFLQLIRPMMYSTIAVALKSDLEAAIDPNDSLSLFGEYHIGIVLVDNSGDAGRMKMRKAFSYLLKSLSRTSKSNSRNPASPEPTAPPALCESRSPGSVAHPPAPAVSRHSTSQDHMSSLRLTSTSTLPTSPQPLANSPSRARSTSDLHLELERVKAKDSEDRKLSNARSINNLPSAASFQSGPSLLLQLGVETTNGHEDEERRIFKEKEARSVQYATLEELLDKLLFLAVSGDDPTFVSHFLLTYRRFTKPRSILLAMQKRMRQLDNSLGDPMLASFAQMRICHLLETWMHTYPQDFAVPGASGALNAIVNSIVEKTYLVHYGADFQPFLDHISGLIDCDATWAQKVEPLLDETEDPYIFDGEDDIPVATASESASASRSSVAPSNGTSVGSSSRERKQSLPLSAKALIMPPSAQVADIVEIPPKQLLKELSKHAQELQNYDCTEIAEEITRIEAKLFMAIQVRFCMLSPPATEKHGYLAKTLATLRFCSWSEGSRIRYYCEIQCYL